MESIDWSNLSFGYMPTDYNVRCIYKDGKWGDITVTSSQTFEIHMAATCLHYGQEAFEGMKAFRGKDGKIRIFRMDENAARLQSSCRGIMMPELPTEKFNEAILTVVKKNERFVPPYESGASLYIRPLLIGTSAQVGVKPAKEYLFIVFVSPVGPYFKEGFKPTPMAILRQYDRAAPLGTGRYKVGGNYAASLVAGIFRRTLSGRQREKIYRRMRPGQLLRHSGKQLYHPEIDVHSPFNHQQKPHATCRGHGHDGRSTTNTGR